MQWVQLFLSIIVFQGVIVGYSYQKLQPVEQRMYLPFALTVVSSSQPHDPMIAEKGIYSIPNGSVYSWQGVIFYQQPDQSDQGDGTSARYNMEELIWPNNSEKKAALSNLTFQDLPTPKKIDGRVAVITQGGIFCYYHFLTEVLGRLAMLEQAGVAYDFVFVPLDQQNHLFIQQALSMWGLRQDQIIEPYDQYTHIQAETLIVPSLIDRVTPDLNPSLSSYVSKETVEQLRSKFLPQIPDDMCAQKNFSKKIFISRKDAQVRKIANEDAVFEQFEQLGFARYELSKLSVQEQICLFANAEQIVGIHGAGLANIIFCKPGTVLIEIFQARLDATYCYLSQLLGIEYTSIATQSPDPDNLAGFVDTIISDQVLAQMLSKVNL